MTSNSCSSVKVGMYLTEPSDTMRGFRQGGPLSCNLFNFGMECSAKCGCASQWHYFSKKCPVATSTPIPRYVTAAFSAIERESTKMGLAVNGDKKVYVVDK